MSEAILNRMQEASAMREGLKDNRIRGFLGQRIHPRPTPGDIGLELEVEAMGLPPFVDTVSPDTIVSWAQHRDGSLRGECTEYVLEAPVNIEEVDHMVDGLFNAFKKKGTKLQLTNRCSTHVHLNFSHLTPRPITSFVALWTIVEEAVTNWCGHHRVSNPFALRAVDSMATLELWTEMLGGARIEEFGPDVRDREARFKYGALNLLPLWTFGSVEVRSLRGAEKRKMVKVWVKFLWALREEARTTFQNPITLAQAVSANDALGLIEGIVERHNLGDFWREVQQHPDNADLRNMLRRGFLLVQPMLFGTKWELVPDREEEARLPDDAQAVRDRNARQQERDFQLRRREEQARLQAQQEEWLRVQREAANRMPDLEEEAAPVPRARRAKPMRIEPIPDEEFRPVVEGPFEIEQIARGIEWAPVPQPAPVAVDDLDALFGNEGDD